MQNEDLYINGKWISGIGPEIVSINPATAEEVWRGKSANNEQIQAAINAARQSLINWSALSFNERLVYLENFTKIITEKQQELTEALALETGKPIWEAKTEITGMIGKLDVSKTAYNDRCKEMTREMQGFSSVTRHKPHGVLVVLGPFNFPGHLPNGHIIPALIAGNTIVFKPSELTSRFAILMTKCWEQAQLPAGVLNLILGAGDVGQALVSSREVDGILFTGSFATGHQIAKASVDFPKRILALEMGGNNPLVVSKPKDIAAAVYLTIQSAFTTAGQRCTCARRLIVINDAIGKEFVQKLCETIPNIKIGAFTEQPEPFMGPLISVRAADKVMQAFNSLVKSGAKVLVGMQKLKENLAFVTPCILDVTGIEQNDDEVFGPLLRLTWVDNFKDAVIAANNTGYGLSAGLIGNDESEYREFLQNINAGIVTWNRPTVGSSSSAPFGGLGKSGNHRPSAYYAADYCAYPIASMESADLSLPQALNPGIKL